MAKGRFAGGTSIEDLAEKYPEKIIKIPIDVFEGITDAQVGVSSCTHGMLCIHYIRLGSWDMNTMEYLGVTALAVTVSLP